MSDLFYSVCVFVPYKVYNGTLSSEVFFYLCLLFLKQIIFIKTFLFFILIVLLHFLIVFTRK